MPNLKSEQHGTFCLRLHVFPATGVVHIIGQRDALLILIRHPHDNLHIRQGAGPGPFRHTWVQQLTCWTVAISDSSGCIRAPSIFQSWTFFRLARRHLFMRKITLTSQRQGRTPVTQPQHDQKWIYGVFPCWCGVLKRLQASSGSSRSSIWASCRPRRLLCFAHLTIKWEDFHFVHLCEHQKLNYFHETKTKKKLSTTLLRCYCR